MLTPQGAQPSRARCYQMGLAVKAKHFDGSRLGPFQGQGFAIWGQGFAKTLRGKGFGNKSYFCNCEKLRCVKQTALMLEFWLRASY